MICRWPDPPGFPGHLSAVDEHRLRFVPDDHQALKIFKITVLGDSVEILVSSLPWAELRRQGAPSAAIAQEIPGRVQVPVEVGRSTECDYKFIVSIIEVIDLIFLAAHGAEPV